MTIDWRVLWILLAARWRITRRAISTPLFRAGMGQLVAGIVVTVVYTLALFAGADRAIENEARRREARAARTRLAAPMQLTERGGLPVQRAGTAGVCAVIMLLAWATWVSLRPLAVPDHEIALLAPLPVSPATYQAYRLAAACVDPRAVPGMAGVGLAIITFNDGWGPGWPVLALGLAFILNLWVVAALLPFEAALRRWSGFGLRHFGLRAQQAVIGAGLWASAAFHDTFLKLSNPELARVWSWLALTPLGGAGALCATPRPLPELLGSLVALLVPAALAALAGAFLATVIHAGRLPDSVLWATEVRGRQAGARPRRAGAWGFLTPLQRLWIGGPASRTLLPTALFTALTVLGLALAYRTGEPHVLGNVDAFYVYAELLPGLVPAIAGFYCMIALRVEVPGVLERATPLLLALPIALPAVASQLARLSAGVHALVMAALYATAWGMGIGPWPALLVPLGTQTLLLWILFETTYAAELAATGPHRWGKEKHQLLPLGIGGMLTLLAAYSTWFGFAALVFAGLMMLAARQDLLHRIPRLADPEFLPREGVRLSGAMITMQAFLSLQMLGVVGFSKAGPLIASAIGFFFAGAITSIVTLFWIWRTRPEHAPRLAWTSAREVLGEAVPVALPLAALGCALKYALAFLPGGLDGSTFPFEAITITVLGFMTVVCAPLFEELIFRGLVYNALRRDFGAGLSVIASALLFAVLHPPISFVAVFSLGVMTALARERTGGIAVPIVIHAIYNFAVVIAGVLL